MTQMEISKKKQYKNLIPMLKSRGASLLRPFRQYIKSKICRKIIMVKIAAITNRIMAKFEIRLFV